MMRRVVAAIGLCGLLAVGRAAEPAPPAAAPPTKVLLRIQFKAGATWTTTYSRNTAQQTKSSDGTVERVTETVRLTSEGKVVKIDGDRATVESQIKSGTIKTKTGDDPEESEELPASKETHTLSARDQVLTHKDDEGNELKAKEGGSLGPETGHGALNLPEKEVGAGDTWEYRTQADGDDDNYTKVKCALVRFTTYAGRPCVEIQGEYQIITAPPKADDQPPGMSIEADATITATFTVYFDYERGRTLAGSEQTSTLMHSKFKFTTPDGDESEEYTMAARINEQYTNQFSD